MNNIHSISHWIPAALKTSAESRLGISTGRILLSLKCIFNEQMVVARKVMLLLRTQRCGLYPAVSRVNRACSITRGELTKEFLRDLRHVMKSDDVEKAAAEKTKKRSQEFWRTSFKMTMVRTMVSEGSEINIAAARPRTEKKERL